jgi:hypothetical protein
MYDYAEQVCKPEFLALARAYVDDVHDKNPMAHEHLRNGIKSNSDRITDIEKTFGGQGSSAFMFDFTDILGVPDILWNLIQGVWNQPEARIEY